MLLRASLPHIVVHMRCFSITMHWEYHDSERFPSCSEHILHWSCQFNCTPSLCRLPLRPLLATCGCNTYSNRLPSLPLSFAANPKTAPEDHLSTSPMDPPIHTVPSPLQGTAADNEDSRAGITDPSVRLAYTWTPRPYHILIPQSAELSLSATSPPQLP